ncbi:MAG: GNAT family N-acetyltransferase [candidate division Zixibacteria bacterium]|nr:GNAT family N-acetyltransferase [candidate division Zixibacteria bacterium]
MSGNTNIRIRPVSDHDRPWVTEIVRGWGADFVVTRGRKVYPQTLAGFLAENDKEEKLGLVTYEIIGDQCEVVTLDALRQFAGVGTALMARVEKAARVEGCRRLWLITTNDNLDAIRFYSRREFTIAAVHVNALALSRKLKPSIPTVGCYGIPMRDEIEFERSL